MAKLMTLRGVTAKDAGDEATSIKFKHGAAGCVVVILDTEGMYHIGASGIDPLRMRDLACTLIRSSYRQQERLEAGLP